MTVCIAAICHWPGPTKAGSVVIVATDRMLTAGAFEYEPPQHKIGRLGSRALALVAGDYSINSEALAKTQQEVSAQSEDDVENIASIYAEAMRTIKRRTASQLYLSPLGLDETSFLEKTKTMLPQLVRDLADQMQSYVSDAECIVTGVDNRMAQIWVIDQNGIPRCSNDIGFAAIGIGSEHALSEFMFAKYTKLWTFHEALLLLYSAKKRAEAAPGVGKDTDLFVIFSNESRVLHAPILKVLEASYKKQQATKNKAEVTARNILRDQLGKLLSAPQIVSPQSASDATSSNPQT